MHLSRFICALVWTRSSSRVIDRWANSVFGTLRLTLILSITLIFLVPLVFTHTDYHGALPPHHSTTARRCGCWDAEPWVCVWKTLSQRICSYNTFDLCLFIKSFGLLLDLLLWYGVGIYSHIAGGNDYIYDMSPITTA